VPNSKADDTPIPTRFIHKIKFDKEGYLVKFKACLVVHGDLQTKQEEDTYAATLTSRVFRILMALIAYFNLEARQFNTINAFLNTKMRKKV
jgi:hypothetical protein